jgi:hypothetical protein
LFRDGLEVLDEAESLLRVEKLCEAGIANVTKRPRLRHDARCDVTIHVDAKVAV